ncbi:unnamed protein product [Rhizoctonia solani]|uniref:Pre-mRNA-splicing factor PRP46 n=1 Tax=Rhizoctonia solani TaxID=456999 RepID=A0A8H3E1X1_9AGAM|nr:unnamed protein product [Rhizoctonia solani]
MKPDNASRQTSDNGEQCSSGSNGRHQQDNVMRQPTPLPIKQVFVLCLMSFAEPVSIFVISPFVNQMIEELGVTSDPKELGYYSGFIDGIFCLAQFFTVYFWGSLSDRIGRRPVLISGLCGVVGSTIMFGLSKSFKMMLVSWALCGMLNGNSAVVKSVLGEITDETNQGAAFAYFSLCWSMGSLLAPALGGFLSHPAERYPHLFGFELFRRYPYLLPCLAGSTFSTAGLVAGVLFLEETLPKDSRPEERRPLLPSKPRTYSQPSSAPTNGTNPQLPPLDGPAANDNIFTPYIRKILISYGFMAYVTTSINALTVLWLYTPIRVGGIGFSSAEIGVTLALSGLLGTGIIVIGFPPLEQRVGALSLYRFSMVMQLLNILVFPLGHAFAIAGGQNGSYFGVGIMLAVRCAGGMIFPCNTLLVTRSAPSGRSRGTINALAQMVAVRLAVKTRDEYLDVQTLPSALLAREGLVGPTRPGAPGPKAIAGPQQKLITAGPSSDGATTPSAPPAPSAPAPSAALTTFRAQQSLHTGSQSALSVALARKKAARQVEPDYHAPWKLVRVISGHLGWVRSVAVEPGNKWFVTGAGDRVIKVWDLASGELRLSLTGHISTVRGLAVSPRHPYLFSAGEDKMVKCWDLETNKVIRHYHGHLSGVYALDLHPTLDVLVTAGRDASARVWDMRTKAQIHVLAGHTGTVADVKCQESDPQVITGSMDSTIRLWDLAAGKTMSTLTHHKKSVRALAVHPTEFSFASGSAGGNNIKKWKCPEGMFVHNFSGHDAIVNTLSVNAEGVLFSGADNGTITLWDYKTGLPFQNMEDIPQPGSLDAEAGVFCSTFDQTGTRLITGGADKTIKASLCRTDAVR